jgi:hypothetical protein
MSERIYIAVGPQCWGEGGDRTKAVKAMKKAWPTFTQHGEYTVWSCPPGSRVNEFGDIAHPTESAPVLVAKGNHEGMRSAHRRFA